MDKREIDRTIAANFSSERDREFLRNTFANLFSPSRPRQPHTEAFIAHVYKHSTEAEREQARRTLKQAGYEEIAAYDRAMDGLESVSLVLARLCETLAPDELKAFRIGLGALAATQELDSLCVAAKRAMLRGGTTRAEAEVFASDLERCERAMRNLQPARDAAARVLARVAQTSLNIREVMDEAEDDVFAARVRLATLEAGA